MVVDSLPHKVAFDSRWGGLRSSGVTQGQTQWTMSCRLVPVEAHTSAPRPTAAGLCAALNPRPVTKSVAHPSRPTVGSSPGRACDHRDMSANERRVALVTGVGREAGMGNAIVMRLARDGFDIAATYWAGLDQQTYGGEVVDEPAAIAAALERLGARAVFLEADLGDTTTVPSVFDQVNDLLGPVSVLVVNHTYCVPTPLLATSLDAFDRHLAVNVSAVLVLIQEFARRFRPSSDGGRILTLTSDHTAGNVPYGVSKGAADRLTDAAAYELGHLGISANAINPGPVDTGWMDDDVRAAALAKTPLGRGGTAEDTANLVSFLCSRDGRWVTGQLLFSNGGFRGTLG